MGIAALAGAALLHALAPSLLDDSYRWVEHSTSQAGAQGADGAWATRTAFLLSGLGVGAVVRARSTAWGRVTTAAHVTFGACFVLVAVWSASHWDPAVPTDDVEDFLHSVAATVMGFAFVLAMMLAAGAELRLGDRRSAAISGAAAFLATWLSVLIFQVPSHAGLAQRAMFLMAGLWYLREVLRPTPTTAAHPLPSQSAIAMRSGSR